MRRDIGAWLFLWCCCWGLFYVLLAHGINYITDPIFTTAYFTAATCVVLALHKDLLAGRLRGLGFAPPLLAGLVVSLGAAVYLLFPAFLPPPTALIRKNPDMFFLYLDLRYLFSKLFDILFQQVLLFLLVFLLRRREFSVARICAICCAVFGAAHLYLIRRNGLAMGGYFLVAAIAAGLLFPYLLIRCRRGLVYTFSLHLLFYIATGSLCWLCPTALLE